MELKRNSIKYLSIFITTIIFFIGYTNGLPTIRSANSSSSDCPFNPCTPQRLGCKRLYKNDLGCLLCKCENMTASSDRPCQLHGCTVELLRCSGSRLKKTEDGCTLCECEHEGATTTTRLNLRTSSKSSISINLPIVPAPDDADPRITLTSTRSPPSADCPNLNCTPEDLECEKLVVNPLTGCAECECAKNPSISGPHLQNPRDKLVSSGGVSENPCPNPTEILDGEQMNHGSNALTKKKPKYKLSIGKLRRGFEPERTYKISLKANKRALPFRAFLFTVKPASSVHSRNSEADQDSSNCGAGELHDIRKRKKSQNTPVHIRPIPHCPTQAIEADGRTNKSVASAEWVAPSCGCVYISVAVVDQTNTVGYLDSALLSNIPITSRINRSLLKTVCVKPSSKNRNHSPKISFKTRTKSWISTDCCYAAYTKQGIKKRKNKSGKVNLKKCDKEASDYSASKSYRYRVFTKNCKRAYASCCYMSPQLHIPRGELPIVSESKPRKNNSTKRSKDNRQRGRNILNAVGLNERPKKKKKQKKHKKNRNENRKKRQQ